MPSTQCPDCFHDFSRRDVMLRHQRQKHYKTTEIVRSPSELYEHNMPQSGSQYKRSPQQQPTPPPHGSPVQHTSPPPPPPPQHGSHKPSPPPPPHGSPVQYTPPPPPQHSSNEPPPPPSGSPVQYTPPPEDNASTITKGTPMVLYHPFTMSISGPTSSGKTKLTSCILQNNIHRIVPTIQRIVWLYKRWQPLYTEIQNTVHPKVEFVRGIPDDLEDDDYFDSNKRNLIILDDLSSITGKDQRITELFTEASHHRNLSVISINQNLYGNRDPTQRRNTQYLIVFNQPVDKQLINTLGRQMYPGNTQQFTKAFAKAVKIPFGYLLIDLKVFTPEDQRLKPNPHWADQQQVDLNHSVIKGDKSTNRNHSTPGLQEESIVKSFHQKSILLDTDTYLEMADKSNSCDDCGLVFDTMHDVQRHVKSGWCPENNERFSKRAKLEIPETQPMDEEEAIEENQAFILLWKTVKNDNKIKLKQLYSRYISDGEESDEAGEMADADIEPYNERHFFDQYAKLLSNYILPLRNSEIHKRILKHLLDKNIIDAAGIKKTLKKYTNDFEDLFETELTDDENSDSEEDDRTSDTESSESI